MITKKPYELSIWIEKLGENGKKEEEKGLIIGAHDMTYMGKATGIVLKKNIKGTNTLTFDMPDRFFDSLKGDFVRNEYIDELFPERKLKLLYEDQWYEFYIKKVNEKKHFKSYIKSFTCTDAFIDELSRNGYGLIFDEKLYNNVEEIGTFTEIILEDSIWTYHPEHNWGDFVEFKEERLYKIPVSQFGGTINGYKMWFELTNRQKENLSAKEVENVATGEKRAIELSDDIAHNCFWDQQYVSKSGQNQDIYEIENPIKSRFVRDIPNDGYIYVPYSCLSFCYGSEGNPDERSKDAKLPFDRAATEIALTDENKNILLAPNTVNPNAIIQFLAIPPNASLKIDEAGVILNKEYSYFLTVYDWNRIVKNVNWYFFEDTRFVSAEALGAEELKPVSISHTFRYILKDEEETEESSILNTYKESWGNRAVIYEGYLTNTDGTTIFGRKYSVTDRTENNISEEIDQFVTVYNNNGNEYCSDGENLFTSNDEWEYDDTKDYKYRVCSKKETRQVIPQLARNFLQNGTHIQSTNGWQPLNYLVGNSAEVEGEGTGTVSSASVELVSLIKQNEAGKESLNITGTALLYYPPRRNMGKLYTSKLSGNNDDEEQTFIHYKERFFKEAEWPFLQFVQDITDKTSKNQNYFRYARITPAAPVPIIAWHYEKDEQGTFKGEEGSISLKEEDYSIANFGIIGQEKKLEKDKIYCLGISLQSETPNSSTESFKLLIGESLLNSDGSYTLVKNEEDQNILRFEEEMFLKSSEDSIFNFDGTIASEDGAITCEKSEARYILFRPTKTIEKPLFIFQCPCTTVIFSIELFEAYTKGVDCFDLNRGTVEIQSYYKYSGRDLLGNEQPPNEKGQDWKNFSKENYFQAYSYSAPFEDSEIREKILFEDDVMNGSTYEYQKYFIQKLVAIPPDKPDTEEFDTFKAKKFLGNDNLIEGQLPLDEAKYTEDNYKIETNYINLSKCQYYVSNATEQECDCSYLKIDGEPATTCYYQKFGYCPYRFQTEKHCRRIRTLKGSKSNRFNLIQEASKVFEFYPQFYIPHKKNGKIINGSDGFYDKEVFFVTEKGNENKVGFRYEKNLKDISREINSEKIVTKLYVEDVDSKIQPDGLCSIKTAEDNPSKDSYIIDMSYYVKKGMLDEDELTKDLYGNFKMKKAEEEEIKSTDFLRRGFLKQLGYYNERYDELSNKIINLQSSSYNELEANLTVNLEGIMTSVEQIRKIEGQMNKIAGKITTSLEENQSYKNYVSKLHEQQAVLARFVSDTFFSNEKVETQKEFYKSTYGLKNCPETTSDIQPYDWFMNCVENFELIKETLVKKHLYTGYGILGQFNKEYLQIQAWKKERASYLKLINIISTAFFKKYEPYLKEGTWTDSNYLTDNAYYLGALDVAADGAIPKVTYNISVLNIEGLPDYEDIYKIGVADTTYVEDIGMFGINKKSGFPNRLKALISEVSCNLDDLTKNTITVQNFTTQFSDLFQQVTATVQSLTYNENIYKRSSNFTSLQNIETNSLQGTLDQNNLTLLNTDENNIQLDNMGTRGSDINNHANKYKLDGQGLFFSNDGGQHWSVGVGPSGINADYIKVGTLDAGKIRIADSNYIYFSWDKNGIAAYRNPESYTNSNINDFVLFNKNGLSVIESGKVKLRAGYNYSGTSGDYSEEQDATQGAEVGFFLYNSEGDPIFSTTASNDKNESAIIQLQGELSVTGQISLEYEYTKRWKIDRNTFVKIIHISDEQIPSGPIITDEPRLLFWKAEGEEKGYFYKEYTNNGKSYIKKDNVFIRVDVNNENEMGYVGHFEGDYGTSSSSAFQTKFFYCIDSLTNDEIPLIKSGYFFQINDGRVYENRKSIDNATTTPYVIAIGNNELSAQKRKFTSITQIDNVFYNFLTIQEDGVYIGGRINGDSLNENTKLNNLPADNFNITAPGLVITPQGEVKIDGKTDIRQLITNASEALPPHSHQTYSPESADLPDTNVLHEEIDNLYNDTTPGVDPVKNCLDKIIDFFAQYNEVLLKSRTGSIIQ